MPPAIPLGAFDLLAPIGRGGIAEVWRGIHRAQRVPVAVKVIPEASYRRGVGLNALRDEVRAVAELDHPHVIWVYDQGVVDEAAGGGLARGSPWFAMELAEGGALQRDPGSWEGLRAVLIPLLEALAHAHARGVIHRDVKPANVLFGGARPGLKLCDFGLMVALGAPVSEGASGTPAYMAPEQCLGLVRDQGPWTDLYAVGCLAFALAAGRNPYPGEGWATVFAGHVHGEIPALEPRFPVPQGFGEWVGALLQKAPRDRFRFAADAIRGLEQLGGPPAPAGIPVDWRPPAVPRFGAGLEEAGLGLFGLRAIPLIGREAECDGLWAALREVATGGEPRAVAIRGGSGTGRSRLADWLGRRAHEVGAASVYRAHHGQDEGPDQGLAGLVLSTLRCEHLDRSAVEERVASGLAADGVEDPAEARLLAQLVRRTDEDAGRIDQRERHGLVRRTIERRLIDRPGVVLIDDAQWGPDALAFARDLLRDPDAPPLLFVLTWLDGEEAPERELERSLLEEIEALPSTRRIELGPLPPEAMQQLVRSVLLLEPELEARVCEISGGHAGLAVQVIADWVARGLIEPSEHGHRLHASRADLPATQVEVFRSRLDAVIGDRGDRWRFPLELAATLGSVVDGEEWSRVCAIRRVEPDAEIVASLREAGLAKPIPGSVGSWAFRHGLVREVLLADAAAQGRLESHHQACARMLRRASGPGTQARLGAHALAGVDLEGAVAPLLAGAEEVFLAGEYGLAARFLGQREDALKILDPPPSDPRWGEGWMLWTKLRRSQGRFEEAQNWLVKVLGAARLHGWTAIEIQARIQAARSSATNDARAPHAERAFELARELGDPALLADARNQLAIEAANRGDNREAADAMQLVIASFEKQDRPGKAQGAWIDLAHIWMQDERYEDVAMALNRADALTTASTSRYVQGLIAMLRGEVARQQGELEEAEAHYLESHRLNAAIGNVSALLARIHVGLTRAEQGRFDEATPDLEACLRASERPFYRLAAHLGLLLCSAQVPAPAGWDAHLAAIVEWAQGGRADADVARVLDRAATLAAEAGFPARARAAWEWSARQLEAMGRLEDARRARAKG